MNIFFWFKFVVLQCMKIVHLKRDCVFTVSVIVKRYKKKRIWSQSIKRIRYYRTKMCSHLMKKKDKRNRKGRVWSNVVCIKNKIKNHFPMRYTYLKGIGEDVRLCFWWRYFCVFISFHDVYHIVSNKTNNINSLYTFFSCLFPIHIQTNLFVKKIFELQFFFLFIRLICLW